MVAHLPSPLETEAPTLSDAQQRTDFFLLHHVPKQLGARAVRWAISSTFQDTHPTAILALLPSNENWSNNWIKHPAATPLLELDPPLLQTKRGVFLGSREADSLYQATSKHTLYLIANPAGRQLLFPTWNDAAVKERLLATCNMDPNFPWNSLHWIAQITSVPTITRDADPCLTPKALRLLMQEATWEPLKQISLTKLPHLSALHLKWDQDIFTAFTDGSCAQ